MASAVAVGAPTADGTVVTGAPAVVDFLINKKNIICFFTNIYIIVFFFAKIKIIVNGP